MQTRLKTIVKIAALLIACLSTQTQAATLSMQSHGHYYLWDGSVLAAALSISGSMTETQFTGTARPAPGIGRDWDAYPTEIALTASISGIADLASFHAAALALPPQTEVFANDHANTVMFDFGPIVGSGLSIGWPERMGMAYYWEGGFIVNFWLNDVVSDWPELGKRLYGGDLMMHSVLEDGPGVEMAEADGMVMMLGGLMVVVVAEKWRRVGV